VLTGEQLSLLEWLVESAEHRYRRIGRELSEAWATLSQARRAAYPGRPDQALEAAYLAKADELDAAAAVFRATRREEREEDVQRIGATRGT